MAIYKAITYYYAVLNYKFKSCVLKIYKVVKMNNNNNLIVSIIIIIIIE